MTSNTFSLDSPPKRPYQSPRLVTYGAVRDLTQAGSGKSSENEPAANGAQCGQTTKTLWTRPPCSSDRNIKQDLVQVGVHPLGIGLYLFDYKAQYRDQWGHGRQFGVMAQEVESVMPQAVSMHPDGYKLVDYALLGISRSVH